MSLRKSVCVWCVVVVVVVVMGWGSWGLGVGVGGDGVGWGWGGGGGVEYPKVLEWEYKGTCELWVMKRDPFYWHGLTLISVRINKDMPSTVWVEFTYLFTKFNFFTVKVVWDRISNFIPHLIIDAITHPFWYQSYFILAPHPLHAATLTWVTLSSGNLVTKSKNGR